MVCLSSQSGPPRRRCWDADPCSWEPPGKAKSFSQSALAPSVQSPPTPRLPQDGEETLNSSAGHA